MLIFLNGRFVSETEAMVSVCDRGFLFGDGLFETLRVFNGRPFRWRQHLDRLEGGAEFLKIPLQFSTADLEECARQLIQRNGLPNSVLRITLSRGVGVRGYSPRGADHPALVMRLHPLPPTSMNGLKGPAAQSEAAGPEMPQWDLITSSVRLPANEPLSRFKTCNKLQQILARMEADAAGAQEALLLNTEGHCIESTSANLFWIEADAVRTAPVASGILPGVTRSAVAEICGAMRVIVREDNATASRLQQAQGVFLTLSSWGVVEAFSLDGHRLKSSPLVRRIQRAYEDLLRAETAA